MEKRNPTNIPIRRTKITDSAAEKTEPQPSTPTRRGVTRSQVATATVSSAGKRKTWKSESLERSPGKNLDGRNELESRNEILDGCKKSPITTIKKTGSEMGSERSPVLLKKTRSGSDVVVDGGGRSDSAQLRKTRSGLGSENGNSSPSMDSEVEIDQARDESGKETEKSGSVMVVMASGEDMIPKELGNVGPDNSSSRSDGDGDDDDDDDGDGGVDCDDDALMVDVNGDDYNESIVHDVDGDEKGLIDDDDDDDDDDNGEEEMGEEIEVEKECLDVKEMHVEFEEECKKETNDAKRFTANKISKPRSNLRAPSILADEIRPSKNKTVNITENLARHSRDPIGSPDERERTPEHNKLQSLVDLIMWRDVSRSAFVFGIGTFIVVSSSYTKEINISLISVVSYLGLIYLATMFLYRSIICRGGFDEEDLNNNCLGEDEAIWLLRLLLPYVNEFLLKIRSLFSGDPAMTMKLAVVLFVLARCGNSITIWKLAKLGFFGIFTIPKFCCSYSSYISAYGKFWIRRFRDAWQSCTHKKAVAFVIFTLFWNMSSVVARIWGAFMLYVAFRYYQQSLINGDDWFGDNAAAFSYDHSKPDKLVQGRRRVPLQAYGRNSIDQKKEKKRS